VFADASELHDLEMLSTRTIVGMPIFSVFHHCGEVPVVADIQLTQLREEEQRLKAVYQRQLAKERRKDRFEVDHPIKFSEGAFAGLSGKVVEHKGMFALVSISGFELPIRVAEALIEDC
jgi:transcription antitermination factor NusG